MKFPISMLQDYVETPLSAAQLGDLLTMAGFELEGIEEVEGESVLDIKVVSNRGDGLSVLGLAREVLAKDPSAKATALYERAVGRFPSEDSGQQAATGATVEIRTPNCTRFAARLFEVRNGDSPEWLQKRMRQVGWRPISLLVDLSNYVMLELGQPNHAYDLEKLAGQRIIVRDALAGEKLTTLNDQEHELQAGQMMICDADGPVGVAGVMGGKDSEVSDSTTKVLLEAAHFVNTSVRRTRNQLGMSTEASYRFERSVDPEGVVGALNRYRELLLEIQPSAFALPGVIDVYPVKAEATKLEVRMERVERLLGMPVALDEAADYVQKLGFQVTVHGETLSVEAPSWRPDIQREDDVTEEIGRVHGYDKIPETLPKGDTTQGGVFGFEAREFELRDAILRSGFIQVVSYSLRDAHPLDNPSLGRIGPRDPHSPEAALLRHSLLPSLAEAARRNGSKDLHLFEIGPVFGGPNPQQRVMLGLLSTGALYPAVMQGETPPKADFFSLKGSLLDAVPGLQFESKSGSDNRYHPTRFAAVLLNGELVGEMGQIHPDAAELLGLAAETVLAEIDIETLLAKQPDTKRFHPISRNPAVRRDLSVMIDKSVPYVQLEDALRGAIGDVLEKQWLFDVYAGQGIPEGKHSLAIALQLRKSGANFTDEEANQVREKAAAALVSLGATLR